MVQRFFLEEFTGKNPKARLRDLYNARFKGIPWKNVEPHFILAFSKAGKEFPSGATIKRDHNLKSDSFLTTVPFERWLIYIKYVYELDPAVECACSSYLEKAYNSHRYLEDSGMFAKKDFKSGDIPYLPEEKIKIPGKWYFRKRYAAALFILAVATIIYFNVYGRYDIARASLEGIFVNAFNPDGKQLWNALLPEDAVQHKMSQPDKKLGHIVARDLDCCGENEVVVYYLAVSEKYNIGKLAVYSNRGKLSWTAEVSPCEKITSGPTEFEPNFSPTALEVVDLDGDKHFEIFVTSNHSPFFPSFAGLFDCTGKKLGCYLNAGHISAHLFKDLNGDGRKEIILGGANNEYNQAALVVFDPLNMSGKSPQTPGTNMDFSGFAEGSQYAYLRFPKLPMPGVVRSVVTETQEYPGGIKIGLKHNLETLDSQYPLSCTAVLTDRLELKSYTIFDNVTSFWHNRFLEGNCDMDCNDETLRMLKDVTRWENGEWVHISDGTVLNR